ncbi:MAG: UDP-N-acetylmuramate--L-alanine ligase [Chloroflexota bacterium]
MTHTHFIGIGGTGLSAIARVLLERGQQVSGSDRAASPLGDAVKAAGAQVMIGHAPENVLGAELVLRSSAVPDDNVEVLAAQQAGIPVVKRIDYLGQLLDGLLTIGVAGSHGKTTTTSMITWMLHALQLEPGFIVGGEVQNLGVNAAAGGGELFVIEADEYDYMFWGLAPTVAVVTNVEHDHPDCFPTAEDFTTAFHGYVERIPQDGSLVACLDDPGAAQLIKYAAARGQHWLSYSLENNAADYFADNLEPQTGAGYRFDAVINGQFSVPVGLLVPGKHNVLNALAAIAAADLLNLDLKKAAAALGEFIGAGRRYEEYPEVGGVLVVDDYGHHPTEINATLQAARSRHPERRIWAVWQPHTYSRTLGWLERFGAAFSDADQVVLTGVYAARETAPQDFVLADVAGAIEHASVHAGQELKQVTAYLLENISAGDLVIVFSAGDATQVSADLVTALQKKEASA